MYDQDHPFYLDPYPESPDQEKDLKKSFEEATAQAIRNVIVLIIAFVLVGVACAVIHFTRSL